MVRRGAGSRLRGGPARSGTAPAALRDRLFAARARRWSRRVWPGRLPALKYHGVGYDRGVRVGWRAVQAEQTIHFRPAAFQQRGADRRGLRRLNLCDGDAEDPGRKHLGRQHRRLGNLVAIRVPDAGTAIIVEPLFGQRIFFNPVAGRCDNKGAAVGREILHTGNGGMVALGLFRWRTRHYPVGGARPSDDVDIVQGGEASVLPIGVVVADQHRDPAELCVEHRETEIAGRSP